MWGESHYRIKLESGRVWHWEIYIPLYPFPDSLSTESQVLRYVLESIPPASLISFSFAVSQCLLGEPITW